MGGFPPIDICQFWIQADSWGLALADILLREGNQHLAVAKEMKLKTEELQNGWHPSPPPKTFS